MEGHGSVPFSVFLLLFSLKDGKNFYRCNTLALGYHFEWSPVRNASKALQRGVSAPLTGSRMVFSRSESVAIIFKKEVGSCSQESFKEGLR